MRRQFAVALFLLGGSAVLLSGCGWFGDSTPQSTGGVAVVDLDEVARQVGASAEMSQAIQAHEASLNTQLQSLKASYVQQIQAKKDELGSEPTPEDNQRLASFSQQATINLASAQQQAKSHLTKHRADLVIEFRKRVAPVAQKIATERGLSLVIPRNEGMILAVDEQFDITTEVAATLKSQWQSVVTPTAPQTVGQSPAGDVQPAAHHEPAAHQPE